MKILKNVFNKLSSKCECFTLNLSIHENGLFDFYKTESVLDFSKRNWLSLNHPAIMEADPFLFVHGNRIYLFYEEMLFEKGLGVIKMTSSSDLKIWSKPVIITSEPKCHFSYPFVFEDNGHIYMMPETGCDHNIRIYQAENGNLSNFKYYKTLLQRKNYDNIKFDYADNCIFKYGRKYYLFSSYFDGNTYYLELYTSDSLIGEYVLHPQSPVCVSPKYGRCGGSIFEYEGKIYRPAQDCDGAYGCQLHIFEITELTPEKFSETLLIENLLPQDSKLYQEGGHHFNCTTFKDRLLVASDARFKTTFLCERIRYRVTNLLKNLF